jgi:uncharacterized membrane protein YccC
MEYRFTLNSKRIRNAVRTGAGGAFATASPSKLYI